MYEVLKQLIKKKNGPKHKTLPYSQIKKKHSSVLIQPRVVLLGLHSPLMIVSKGLKFEINSFGI